MISELLGVPSAHMEQFKAWSDLLVSTPKDKSEEAEKPFWKNEISVRKNWPRFLPAS